MLLNVPHLLEIQFWSKVFIHLNTCVPAVKGTLTPFLSNGCILSHVHNDFYKLIKTEDTGLYTCSLGTHVEKYNDFMLKYTISQIPNKSQ